MVKLRADEPGEAGRGDQGFGFSGFGVGDAAAREISTQHEVGDEHGAGDRKTEGGDGEWAKVQEGDHKGKIIS
jgi:hypothetical protein